MSRAPEIPYLAIGDPKQRILIEYMSLPLLAALLLASPWYRWQLWMGRLKPLSIAIISATFLAGAAFELPVLLVLLARDNPASFHFLQAHPRHTLLSILALSALITPTKDLLGLARFSIPLMLVYSLGAATARSIPQRQPQRMHQ